MSAARQVRLARQPGQHLAVEDFVIAEEKLPALADGEVLVRNQWMSIDPYMRLPLTPRGGFHPSVSPGDAMEGAAVGIVEDSRDFARPAGTIVLSQKGWRDRFVAPGTTLSVLPSDDSVPLSWYVGFLGLTGLTAFAGIERTIEPQAGETIFISGASGGVGAVACRLAKLRGARVLGAAGSAEKLAWLRAEMGVDAVTNYRTDDLAAFLAREAPDGLDCYFDNVGGDTLDIVLSHMKGRGRIGLCGAMAQYEDENYRTGPSQFFTIIEKMLTVKGFNAGLVAPKAATILPWLAERALAGEIAVRERVVEGLDAAPAAFVSLFTGTESIGKLVVRLDPVA